MKKPKRSPPEWKVIVVINYEFGEVISVYGPYTESVAKTLRTLMANSLKDDEVALIRNILKRVPTE